MNRTQTSEPLSGAFEAIRNQPPQPPAHLREQCLATVPQAQPSHPQVLPGLPRLTSRLGLAAAVCAAVWTVATQPTLTRAPQTLGQPASPQAKASTVAPSAAYAESMSAMQSVRFWHEKAIARDVLPGFGKAFVKPHSSPPTVSEPMTHEEWYDAQRGYRTRRPNHESLTLPTGDQYIVQDDWRDPAPRELYLLKGTAAGWYGTRRWLQNRITDPLTSSVKGQDLICENTKVTEAPGQWNGTPVTVFTLTETVKPLVDGVYWPSQTRLVLYADRKTKRFLATRRYKSFPDFPQLGEILEFESTFDYETRPPASVFELSQLKRQVTSLHTVRRSKEAPIFEDVEPVQRWENAAKP